MKLIRALSLAFLFLAMLAGLACRQGDSESEQTQEPLAATDESVEAPVEEAADLGPRLADHEPTRLLDDLAEMRDAGALRILVHRQDLKGMHRPGAAGEEEITLVSMFADSLDLPRTAFIDGGFRPAQSGDTFPTVNPATGETLAELASCGADDIDFAAAGFVQQDTAP